MERARDKEGEAEALGDLERVLRVDKVRVAVLLVESLGMVLEEAEGLGEREGEGLPLKLAIGLIEAWGAMVCTSGSLLREARGVGVEALPEEEGLVEGERWPLVLKVCLEGDFVAWEGWVAFP